MSLSRSARNTCPNDCHSDRRIGDGAPGSELGHVHSARPAVASRRQPAALLLALTLASSPMAHAQPGTAMQTRPAPAAIPVAPEITVSATRERREVDETTSTVTVITAEDIEARFVRDIRDLVRNEPGVSVRRAPARFGAAFGSTGRDGSAGFNIRGLEGNRVLQQVDGIRVPAAFAFGASNFGRGGYTEIGTVRTVEILRGPASSLYGSDGVAGVVSFITFDPADLLAGGDHHASAAAAYASEDRSTTLSVRGAARLGGDGADAQAAEVMAIVTGRMGSELDGFGTVDTADARRTAPNPQDHRTGSILAKWVQPLSGDSRIRFTFEHLRTTVETDVLSGRSVAPVGATGVLRLDARDTTERTRLSADSADRHTRRLRRPRPQRRRQQAAQFPRDGRPTHGRARPASCPAHPTARPAAALPYRLPPATTQLTRKP